MNGEMIAHTVISVNKILTLESNYIYMTSPFYTLQDKMKRTTFDLWTRKVKAPIVEVSTGVNADFVALPRRKNESLVYPMV